MSFICREEWWGPNKAEAGSYIKQSYISCTFLISSVVRTIGCVIQQIIFISKRFYVGWRWVDTHYRFTKGVSKALLDVYIVSISSKPFILVNSVAQRMCSSTIINLWSVGKWPWGYSKVTLNKLLHQAFRLIQVMHSVVTSGPSPLIINS